MTRPEDVEPLPAELDNETVIFSYGSLLEHAQLRELLKHRGEFRILEARDLKEAAALVKGNPEDIVILRNVLLKNVRVSLVTETMLRRWFKNRGGDIENLLKTGAGNPESPPAVFLYARPADLGERGKSLNGGLICNFCKEELAVLDKYEFEPVLKRMPVPELKIEGRAFFPRNITFYAGTAQFDDKTPAEKAERTRFLNLNRKPGEISPQARWPKNVRRG